ncbi:MAG: N-acetylmuramoyl-L-alanine amidase [Chroococcidiopsidaceae cyanobacterium CP_BM_RX_35]|nr:N-acetylmuramoyl-L-alanine amidase [Chroococcidiopsidaceae cyanobacterium CP_BM_RX_35]
MKKILGLTVLVTSAAIALPAKCADRSLYIAFPPTNYQTTTSRIFILGTAPPTGEVSVNGTRIERSPAGHFAPSVPLHLGDNLLTVQYQNQRTQIHIKRLPTQPQPPIGLAFAKDSLTPDVDIARLPGELVCFSAIAPPKSTVAVELGGETIPLPPQSQNIKLPANSAALTQRNQPASQSATGHYQGCATLSVAGVNLGQPKFQLKRNGATTSQMGSGKISVLSPVHLEVAEVTADQGVARTGPSTDYSRLTPLPKGTQATVTGKQGKWLRLDYGGWIDSAETRILPSAVPPRSFIRSVTAHQVPGNTDVMFPLQVPVPVSVQQGDRTLTLTLYNTTAQTDVIHLDDDPVISRLDWQQVAPNQVQYTFNLKPKQQWGYKVRYDGTTLVLSLRHPPATAGGTTNKELSSSSSPLAGINILLDPGHGGTDSGTTGPTGLNEKAVTLVMAKLVQEQLVARGATVYLTREEDKTVGLADRVEMIDKFEPAISISLHYNSLPDDGDAQHTQGLGAFWYNAQAHSLAVFLHNYLVNKLGRHSYGVFWDNLFLTRPTSAPSILLELGFMSNPREFEWVVNPQQQQKLAVAIADGITEWFDSAH